MTSRNEHQLVPCRRCGVTTDRKPLVSGKRVCVTCDEYVRLDNLRRRGAKREHERARYGHLPIEVTKAIQDAVYMERLRLLHAWAKRHGRVPTLREVADIIGLYGSSPQGGQPGGQFSRMCPQNMRRAAFGLVARKTGRTAIPFPVPADFLETGS